jgi:7-cyano-7-deazaguanine synthase
VAVLISGGLDSAILAGDAVRHCTNVYPLYVRFGLTWEDSELAYLRRYLAAIATPALHELTVLHLPVADLYGEHWSITGKAVPLAGTPDEAVFLPGRNVFFLAKGMVWCHLHGVPAVALGSLGSNPFPDATPAFFRDFAAVVNGAIGADVKVRLPFRGMSKTDVMQLARTLPLEHTFSCMQPNNGHHCGRCNKCAERKEAFAAAGMTDPTRYQC